MSSEKRIITSNDILDAEKDINWAIWNDLPEEKIQMLEERAKRIAKEYEEQNQPKGS